jgi:hypothetical protein
MIRARHESLPPRAAHGLRDPLAVRRHPHVPQARRLAHALEHAEDQRGAAEVL